MIHVFFYSFCKQLDKLRRNILSVGSYCDSLSEMYKVKINKYI